MKASSFLYFAGFGIKTILFRKKKPILGTVIVTDTRESLIIQCHAEVQKICGRILSKLLEILTYFKELWLDSAVKIPCLCAVGIFRGSLNIFKLVGL